VKRTAISVSLTLALALPARAGTFDETFAKQKNGLWETTLPGQAQPMRFCVTDAEKLDAAKQTREAFASLGCKAVKDARTGDRFELRYACSSPSEGVGKFEYFVTGTTRPDRVEAETRIVGGGQLMQHLAAAFNGPTVSRWVRPCKSTEKPGVQK